jgi:Domain of unknown function (DUF4149)
MSFYILAAVVGIMIFFTIAVAPTIFMVLPQEWSSAYVRKFFPKYYIVLGVLCALAGVLTPVPYASHSSYLCAVLFAFSLFVLTPMINQATDTGQKKRFGILHGASVIINIVQLLLLLYVLWRSLSQ